MGSYSELTSFTGLTIKNCLVKILRGEVDNKFVLVVTNTNGIAKRYDLMWDLEVNRHKVAQEGSDRWFYVHPPTKVLKILEDFKDARVLKAESESWRSFNFEPNCTAISTENIVANARKECYKELNTWSQEMLRGEAAQHL